MWHIGQIHLSYYHQNNSNMITIIINVFFLLFKMIIRLKWYLGWSSFRDHTIPCSCKCIPSRVYIGSIHDREDITSVKYKSHFLFSFSTFFLFLFHSINVCMHVMMKVRMNNNKRYEFQSKHDHQY